MPEIATFDHYEVLTRDDGSLHELGRGAMGVTYKAYDTSLRIPVALKVIAPNYLNSETARQRFVREARSAAKLRHRNVASVFHLGTGNTWFYAMEYIAGETLEALIRRQGPMNPLLSLQVVDQVARALNAAQQIGLVHRDIKPANLMLVREDDELIVKVIDFGLAKSNVPDEGDEDAATISMGGFVGTPHFASPEQLEEKEIDVRSDIYSLGVTLWYMLSGQAPFAGSMAQVMSQHLTKPPPFEQFKNLPDPLSTLLKKMLEKDPIMRHQTPAAVRVDIEGCMKLLSDHPTALQQAVGDEENFATVLEDASHRAAESAWETGATIGRRYRITESRGETASGSVFRASDTEAKRDVRLLRLKPELVEDQKSLAAIELEVARIAAVDHPNLLGILGFETIEDTHYLAMEWTDGFTLLEVLRVRRELPASEVLVLLEQAAAGTDAALAGQLHRVDFALHQVRFAFPKEFDKEQLLHAPITTWPPYTLKLNPLGITHELSQSATWAGGQTMVGGMSGPATAELDPATRYIQALGAIAYEALGGTPPGTGNWAAKGYTPLATISEEGNALLRRALTPGQGFPSAENFHRALAGVTELEVKRHGPSTTHQPSTSVPAQPARTPIVRVPASHPPQPPRKHIPVMFIGGIATVAAISFAVYFFAKPDDNKGGGKNPATPTPAPVVADVTPKPELPVDKDPDEKPAIVDNKVPPATPRALPKNPDEITPSRKAMLSTAIVDAEKVESEERWPEALTTYLKLAKEYPESETGRVHVEMMLGRMIKMPRGLTPEIYSSMKDGLLEAAQLDVVAAMALLADTLRDRDPVGAFNWMTAAAAKGHVDAMTQVGLMLSNGAGCTRDLGRAVQYFQMAVERNDPAGKAALAECLLAGKGIDRDEKRAMALLHEAASQDNARAMNRLGDCYRKGVGVKQDYADAMKFFNKAADLNYPESMSNLGVMYYNGEGMKTDLGKAVALFQKAARVGDPHGMFLYAQCLYGGTGIVENKLQANSWFKKSAEAGFRPAIDWCNKYKIDFTPKENR